MSSQSFTFRIPCKYTHERVYTINFIFSHILGLHTKIIIDPLIDETVCHLNGNLDVHLKFPDRLFGIDLEEWLSESSLPNQGKEITFKIRDREFNIIPVYYSNDENMLNEDGNIFPFDIFGSVFFLITRYEEHVIKDRDSHGRFLLKHSVFFNKLNIIRPIVEEYIMMLRYTIEGIFHIDTAPSNHYSIDLSHDMDYPFIYMEAPFKRILALTVSELIKRRRVSAYLKGFLSWLTRNSELDPFNSVKFIFNTNKKYSTQSEFYFIATHNPQLNDGNYSIGDKKIVSLIKNIISQGGVIGLHPSYFASGKPDLLKSELKNLEQILNMNRISAKYIGGRYHYLRWEDSSTWSDMQDAGLSYDCSLGFADHIGFRCGTSRHFRTFDIRRRKELDLIERPLLIMDVTLFSKDYMALSHYMASQNAYNLVDICREYKIPVSILWHNNNLVGHRDRRLYTDIIDYAHENLKNL